MICATPGPAWVAAAPLIGATWAFDNGTTWRNSPARSGRRIVLDGLEQRRAAGLAAPPKRPAGSAIAAPRAKRSSAPSATGSITITSAPAATPAPEWPCRPAAHALFQLPARPLCTSVANARAAA